MKLSSIDEAIADYERITGETFEQPQDCAIKILPSNEFMIWKLGLHNGVPFFFINQTYGEMIHFGDFIREVCKEAGITQIVTSTTRNPKMHIRKWKMERLPEFDYEHEGRRYFMLNGLVSSLK
jgi:hypothetical protein